jgi:large subunit ribosomal protein L11
MAKKIKAVVKLQIKAGAATPAPPVGQILAPHGLNISEFCQKFNEATRDKMGSTIPAQITIYEDRTFDFVLQAPPAAELIMKAVNIEKGSGEPQKKKVAKITKDQLKKIAETKMQDLNANDIESAMKIIEGTAKSMGISVE